MFKWYFINEFLYDLKICWVENYFFWEGWYNFEWMNFIFIYSFFIFDWECYDCNFWLYFKWREILLYYFGVLVIIYDIVERDYVND